MAETGLLDEWRRRYQKDDGHCTAAGGGEVINKKLHSKGSSRQPPTQQRISIKNLSGAFVILLIGIVASITIFIGELILFRLKPNHRSVFVNQPPPAAPSPNNDTNTEVVVTAVAVEKGKTMVVEKSVTDVEKDDENQVYPSYLP